MYRHHHDRRIYYVADEGTYRDISMLDERAVPEPLTTKEAFDLGLTEEALKPVYKFGRMFGIAPKKDEAAYKIEKDALIELGQALNKNPPGSGAGADSTIPAGYTYLGQFITHEITFDGMSKYVPEIVLDLDNVPQERSPSIDGDSLYGAGPEDPESAKMYEPYKRGGYRARLKLGTTVRSPKWKAELPRDLLRERARAVIGDPRNDENLPLAQTHVAFILFHNELVTRLAVQGYSGKELFEKAREQVIRHLQWIVLEDYLPRVIQRERIKETIDYARANNYELKFFKVNPKEDIRMPVEFSVAAFRLGHSMVRETYEWNLFHNSSGCEDKEATLKDDFFRLTGFSGQLDGQKQLPSDWIIDWRHFYDFTEIGLKPHPIRDYNRAKMIDTRFDFHLDTLFGYPHDDVPKHLRSITVRNLLRGFALRVPTGQAVAKELGLPKKEILTEAEIAESWDPQISSIVKKFGFDRNTPLWYYILKEAEKEAEVFKNGYKLGPVGSRIIAETFVGIILNSNYSIIKDRWTPSQGDVTKKNTFGMADMLAYTKNIYPKEEVPCK